MKRLNIAVSAAAAVLVIVFTCLGSFSEISDYDVVSGIALDYEKGEWIVTCEICMPFENAGRRSANILYTGGNQLYLIGENARGKDQLREYFLKDDINLRAVTVYTRGKAAKIFEHAKEDENSRAKSLATAKKVSRFCSENHLPSPKVTEYLKGNIVVTISENETPIKAVADNA